MQEPLKPADEQARLRSLRALGILDTPSEERFDRYTRMASRLFNVPTALVSLVDENRQWFKSRQGLDALETPRSISFCGHAILQREPLIIPDATSDPRFADNPMVVGPMGLRFYAGCPLYTLDGYRVGTLCLLDYQPRQFTAEDIAALKDLASMVETEMNFKETTELQQQLSSTNQKLQHVIETQKETETRLRESEERLSLMLAGVQDGVWDWDVKTNAVYFSSRWKEIIGYQPDEFPDEFVEFEKRLHLADRERVLSIINNYLAGQTKVYEIEFRLQHKDGSYLWILSRGKILRDKAGLPYRMVGSHVDLTSHKKAEEQLAYQQSLLKAQADGSREGILVVGGARRWLSYNQRFVDMWGIPQSIIEGDSSQEAVQFLASLSADPAQFTASIEELYDRPNENRADEIELNDGRVFSRYTTSFHNNDDTYYGRIWYYHDITAQKQQAKALQEREERLRLIFDTSPDAIVVYDSDGSIEYINAAFERLFGWTQAEMFGERTEFIPLKRLIQEETVYEFDTTRLTKDGRFLYVQLSGAIIKDELGDVLGSIVFARNTTERQLANDALRERENRLRLILDTSPDAIVVYDAEGKVEYLNTAFEQMFGWTLDGVSGQRLDFVPSDAIEETKVAFQKLFAKSQVSGFDTTRLTKDGRVVFVQISASLIKNELDEVAGSVVFTRDITDRKRADDALRERENRLQLFFDSSPDAVVMYDRGGLVEYVNPAFQSAFGWATEDVAGQRIDFVPPEHLPETRNALQELLTNGKFLGFDTRRLTKDGQLRDVQQSGAMIYDAQQQPTGSIIFTRDITAQKKAERALAKAFTETEAQAQRLNVLYELANALGQTTERTQAFQVLVSMLPRIVAYHRTSVALVNPDGLTATVIALDGGVMDPLRRGDQLSLENSYVGHVVRSKLPRVVVDADLDNAVDVQNLAKVGVRSIVGFPLMASGEVIGTLNIAHEQPNIYGDTEVRLVQQVASLLSATLEGIRLLNQTQTTLAETERLYQAGEQLNRAQDYEQVLQVLREFTVMGKNLQTVNIGIFDQIWTNSQRPALVTVVARSSVLPGETFRDEYVYHDIFPSVYQLLQRDQPIFIEDTLTDSRLSDDRLQFAAKSVLFVPLVVGGRWFGVISADYAQMVQMTETDLAQIMAIASQAAVAIQNLRSLESLGTRASQLERLSQVEASLSQAITEEEIISAIAIVFADPTLSLSLEFIDTDEHGQPEFMETVAVWEHGLINHQAPTLHQRYNLAELPTSNLWIRQPNQLLFVSALEDDSRVDAASRNLLKLLGVASFVVIPLYGVGRWQGLIGVYWRDAHLFDETEKFLLRRILEPAAAAVASRRASLAQQVALAETDALYRISKALTSTRTIEEMGQAVLTEYLKILNLSQGGVLLFNDDGLFGTLIALMLKGDFVEAGIRVPLSNNPPLERVIATKQPFKSRDVANDPLFDSIRDLVKQLGYNSLLLVPIVAQDRVIGLLGADALEGVRDFSEREIDLVKTAGDMMGITLQNQWLFNDVESALAETDQLYQVSLSLNSATIYEEVLQSVLKPLSVPPDRCLLVLVEVDERDRPNIAEIVTVQELVPSEASQMIGQRYNVYDEPTTQLCLKNPSQPLMIGDIATDARLQEETRAHCLELGISALMLLPLRIGRQWIGFISIGWFTPQSFNAQERRIYQSLMLQLAVAVSNLRNSLVQQRSLLETEQLYQISLKLIASTNYEELLHAVITIINRADIFAATLFTFEMDENGLPHLARRRAIYHRDSAPPFSLDSKLRLQDYAFGDQYLFSQPNTPIMMGDIASDGRVDEALRHLYQQIGIASTVIMGLARADEWLGMLTLSWDAPRQFSERERRLYQAIATQAALQLSNQRLLNQVKRRAYREQTIRQITEKMRQAKSIQELTQITAEQLGERLSVKRVAVQLGNE